MDLTWVPGVVTAIVLSGAQHILFTGRALQRLDEIGRRIEHVETHKVDRETHALTVTGEVKRLDGRIDHVEEGLTDAKAEIVLNRTRYHDLAGVVQAKMK
jgi:hypothetical protein